LDFYDSFNTLIGDADTPNTDSHTGSWTNYTNYYSIPVGTRSITYNMVFVLNQGENIDLFVDDNVLTVGSLTQTPEPSTFLLVGIGVLEAGLFLRRKRPALN
jgi:hypothetical protein